jgi:multiple sugar transport system permease protein
VKAVTLEQKLIGLAARLVSLLAVLVVLFPILWMVRTSIMDTVMMYQQPPVLLFTPTLRSYQAVMERGNLLIRFFNSSFIASMATIVCVVSGTMAAYGISRFRVPFGKSLPVFFLFVRMVPGIAILLPVFLMYRDLRMIDTYRGLILLYATNGIPFIAWIMWGFYQELSPDMEESAYIDGSGPFRTFARIVVPITTPAVAAVAILAFTGSWNEFMMATILTRTRTVTLPPGVYGFVHQSDLSWDLITAGGTIISIPVVLFCIFAQKYFIHGLTLGAVKG